MSWIGKVLTRSAGPADELRTCRSAVQCLRRARVDFWQSREHLLRTEQKRQDDFGCFFSASRASVYLSVFAKLALASGYSFFILGSGCVWSGHAGVNLLVLHLLPFRLSCAYGCILSVQQLDKQARDDEPWVFLVLTLQTEDQSSTGSRRYAHSRSLVTVTLDQRFLAVITRRFLVTGGLFLWCSPCVGLTSTLPLTFWDFLCLWLGMSPSTSRIQSHDGTYYRSAAWHANGHGNSPWPLHVRRERERERAGERERERERAVIAPLGRRP